MRGRRALVLGGGGPTGIAWEMRRLHARLEELGSAAGSAQVRQRADQLVPEVGNRIWISNSDFFHRETSSQWRRGLDADTLPRRRRPLAELVPADLTSWADRAGRSAGHWSWTGQDGSSTAERTSLTVVAADGPAAHP